jgi:hypothetical protein
VHASLIVRRPRHLRQKHPPENGLSVHHRRLRPLYLRFPLICCCKNASLHPHFSLRALLLPSPLSHLRPRQADDPFSAVFYDNLILPTRLVMHAREHKPAQTLLPQPHHVLVHPIANELKPLPHLLPLITVLPSFAANLPPGVFYSTSPPSRPRKMLVRRGSCRLLRSGAGLISVHCLDSNSLICYRFVLFFFFALSRFDTLCSSFGDKYRNMYNTFLYTIHTHITSLCFANQCT